MRLCRSIAVVTLFTVILTPPVLAADKLKGFYSGSGGVSAEVHRVVLIEFAADGTAILQQKWHEKDPQTWYALWKKEGKTVTLTYQPAKNAPTPAPPLPTALVFTFKHGTLTPTDWDAATLGVLGPPKLTPFDGNNPQAPSVSTCQGFNTLDPRRDCVTWGSNR